MSHYTENENTIKNLQKMGKMELIIWLRQRSLLKSSVDCDYCSITMSQHACRRSVDEVIFKCKNSNCSKKSTTQSIRKGSFFGINQPLLKVLEFLYHYSNQNPMAEIKGKLDISQTASDNLCHRLKTVFERYFQRNPIRLGGYGTICHVDETLLSGKRKYNVGSVVSTQTWVLVIVDTSFQPALGYATIVENRSSNVLIPIISRVCLPGTTIYTDQWRSYNTLGDKYDHYTVNHKVHFVDPITGINTQNAESYNNKLKVKIKYMRGIKKASIAAYLVEFNFRERFRNVFEKILDEIKINNFSPYLSFLFIYNAFFVWGA